MNQTRIKFTDNYRAKAARILLGSINRNSMPVQRNAIQVNRLNSYNPTTLQDDISLIKLDTPVPFTASVKAIKLPTRSQASTTYLNSLMIVSGFGLTTANQVSTTLQYASVIGISTAECRSVFGSLVTSSILCTRGYPNMNKGSCSGDSGGPLIFDGSSNSTVVGIVSFGAAMSCTMGYPQGFTRVGPYLNYISSVTGITLQN